MLNSIRYLLILVGLIFYQVNIAQNGFVIGYNGGSFLRAQRNIQAYSQAFNLSSENELIQEMRMFGLYRGLVVGFKGGDDGFSLGVRWSTKKAESNWGENEELKQKLRIRMNTVNLEMGFGSEELKAGFSIDVGGLKVHTKKVDKVNNTSTKWEKFYAGGALVSGGTLATGLTLFVELQKDAWEFRPFFQIPLGEMGILDDRTMRDYLYPGHNFGVSLSYVLGS
ncbi:MAG: hypothetical protein LPK45_04985 [Bacteroidota bacterium]|nr:hypothetical protein [Bacteroidota bacterium]MDX5430414.1 hypothetical protein [Bacteroidota bacterium]MDX5469173.1 hypothetical protein [Bacteroidota bacterium]